MKAMWKLSNYFFVWMVRRSFLWTLLLTLGAAGINLLANAFPQAGGESDMVPHFAESFRSYEMILDKSLIWLYFAAGLLLVFWMILWHARSYSTNGKEIYTLYTLPMKREEVYFAFLLSGAALILLYFLAWLIFVVAVYAPIMSNYAKTAAEEVFRVSPDLTISGLDATRTNGLYLAFQRSAWLYVAFPSNPARLLFVVSGMLLILASLIYAGFCPVEAFERVAAVIAGVFFPLFCIVRVLWLHGTFGAQTEVGSALISGLCCLVFAIFIIWRSVVMVRKCYTL